MPVTYNDQVFFAFPHIKGPEMGRNKVSKITTMTTFNFRVTMKQSDIPYSKQKYARNLQTSHNIMQKIRNIR